MTVLEWYLIGLVGATACALLLKSLDEPSDVLVIGFTAFLGPIIAALALIALAYIAWDRLRGEPGDPSS